MVTHVNPHQPFFSTLEEPVNELFRAVSDRLKTIFTVHAALELEAELLIGHVERKAGLLKRAAQLEQDGLVDLAGELRQHASAMDLGTSVKACPALPGPEQTNGAAGNASEPDATPSTGRKKR
jgi:hypothetical protein